MTKYNVTFELDVTDDCQVAPMLRRAMDQINKIANAQRVDEGITKVISATAQRDNAVVARIHANTGNTLVKFGRN